VLVAGEVLGVAALHRLGDVDGFVIPRQDLGQWLREAPSEDVLLAGIRVAALAVAWWLLGTTLLYVAARLAHLHSAARALGWATLPAVRRWADRAAAVSIVAASAFGTVRPAAADPPPPTSPTSPPVVVDLDHRERPSPVPPERSRTSVRTGRSGDPPARPAPQPEPTTPPTVPVMPPIAPVPPATEPRPAPPSASAAPPLAPNGGAVRKVERGDHLWSIAAEHLAAITGQADPSAADIGPYWWRVVELNRSRLRSGNPNLVYPGEVVELPPL
jgi:hypothetical protein